MEPHGSKNRKKEQKPWTSRSIGSSIQHRFFYALIRIGGRRLAYFFMYFIVGYYILFRPSVRKKSYFYLSHRFPEATAFKRIFHSYRLSSDFGKILIDRAIIGILGSEQFSVSFERKEALKKLVSEGKGVIFLMAHVGCWQASLSALSYLKTRVNMVIRREEGDVDRHYFEHQSKESPFNIIDPEGYLGGTLDMVNALKNGEIVSIMGDRIFGNPKNTVSVEFMGERALFPFSAFKVASATGAPVIVLFTFKKGANKFGLDLVKVMNIPENLGRSGEKYKPYVSEFVKMLERYADVYPYQFFNFYDIWEQH